MENRHIRKDATMENIIFAAAMIAAFILGAYIRKPFAVIKRKEAPKPQEAVVVEEEKHEKEVMEDIQKLLRYTGREKGGE